MVDHHDIWVLTLPGFQSLDLFGPHDVFSAANDINDDAATPGPRYRLRLVSPTGGPVASASGVGVLTDPVPVRGRSGTLLIPGGAGARAAATDPDLVAVVASLASRAGRVLTVCTGAYLAAAAGILDGRRVATHWAWAADLARRHPTVRVDAESLHVADGSVWSSAGVAAGMDLALAVVEHDHDPTVAQLTARWLVLHLRRPGTQSQFAAPVWSEPSPLAPIRAAQRHIEADPAADHGVERLAARVGLSARHFSRLFAAEVGETPARFVERVRIDAARLELETAPVRGGLQGLAARCGFASAEVLRRAFHRRLGLSPDDYRRRFRLPDPAGTPLRAPRS